MRTFNADNRYQLQLNEANYIHLTIGIRLATPQIPQVNTQKPGGKIDVAQLVERRTGTPMTQVQFPDAARDCFPESTFSVQSLTMSVHSRVQSHAITFV